ncbi:MAG: rod shape-determining protein MreD [Endomicrobia bacterium]|jgi:rod shape-determining protein MreD|nr:rod shape-determining protein MreD [Endomicrobiia bacterium]
MRKILYYIFFYVLFCLLQFFFGRYINVYGIFPNFILIAVVYLGLSRGRLTGETMGFFLGLTWDAFSTDVFGVRAIMFTVIGYFAGMMNKSFDKDQIFTQIIVVFFANVIYWAGFSLLYYIIPEGSSSYTPFVITMQGSIKIAVTVVITPVIFYILNAMTKFGRKHI